MLYLNATEQMARLQVEHKLAGQPYDIEDLDPGAQHDLVEVDVAETDALDLVSAEGLAAVGLPASYPLDALGHPIGASGGRIVATMVHELARSGGGLGLAAICSGGGQGDALLLEV